MPVPIQATTQEHLDIEDIVENLLLLKDGSTAMIITTTAVNFGLLSEPEQDATIYAYAALLNSLTFSIQILIRSSRKDISAYEKLLTEQEMLTPNPENKQRIKRYREFIQETVRERNVLDKKFYIIIPFSVLELGVAKSATALVKGSHHGLPFPKDYIIKRAKMSLEPKYDHLVHQLARLGLRARQLTTKELIQLMFEIYNPDSAQGQILASPEEYETPLVKPAVAFQENPQITDPEEKPSTSPINNQVQTAKDQLSSPTTQPAKASAASPPVQNQTSQPILQTDTPLPESLEKNLTQDALKTTPTPSSPPSELPSTPQSQPVQASKSDQNQTVVSTDQETQTAINAALGKPTQENQINPPTPESNKETY